MKTATFYSYLPKRYTANDAHTERVVYSDFESTGKA